MNVKTPDEPIHRELLEAAIWRAMYDCEIFPERPNAFVGRLVSIATRYAAGDDPLIQAERREILREAR